MNGYNTVDEIEEEFRKGELSRMDAIKALEDEFNYLSKDAESTVDKWLD